MKAFIYLQLKAAQNILHKQRREFTTADALNSETPRNVFGRITLRF